MKTTVLTSEDIQEIVHRVGINKIMQQLIDELDIAFKQYDPSRTDIPLRSGFTYDTPHSGLLEWMPIMQQDEVATIKIVGYHPANPQVHQLPTILSSISLYDLTSGHLLSVMDGTFLTALRTGAASAIASRYLARRDAKTVGLIGAGAQALTQLHALSLEFDINSVLVYDVNPDVSRRFVERAAFMNLPITVMTRPERETLVAESDILCTATSTGTHQDPVFEYGETRPWLHINAVGSDFPGKIELPVQLLNESYISPDFLEQALLEGECQQVDPNHIGLPLFELMRRPEAYNMRRMERTVFDSTGWALEDSVTAQMFLDCAEEFGLGKAVQLEVMTGDPQNPYEFLSD